MKTLFIVAIVTAVLLELTFIKHTVAQAHERKKVKIFMVFLTVVLVATLTLILQPPAGLLAEI